MNSLAVIGNLLSGDGLIIFLILLLLFGAKKLPELARGLGSAMREFSKAKDEIHEEMTRPPAVSEPRLEAPRHTEPYSDPHQVVSAAPAPIPTSSTGEEPHSSPSGTTTHPA